MRKPLALILLLITPIALIAQTGVISTFAGNGSGGYAGDGGQATSAGVGAMAGISFDSVGNFYIAENNHTIRKVNTTGLISIYAGISSSPGYGGDGGLATYSQLNTPLATCASSSLYISDAHNNRIRRVNLATAVITTVVGNGTAGFSGDSSAATAGKINNPYGVCLDTSGNLYITDNLNYRIRKIATSGTIYTYAGNGTSGIAGDGGPATAANLGGLGGLQFGIDNNLYFVDGGRIRTVNSTTGIISTVAGSATAGGTSGDGGPATAALLRGPVNIAFNSIGELYIADANANNVRKIDTFGIMHTVAGTGGTGFSGDGGMATAATVWSVRGVAVDACDNLYISDNGNYRIRKVTFPYAHTATTLSITSNTSDTVCTGMPVTYTATTTATGALTYQWQVNGSNVGSGGASYTYSPANGDNVKCVLVNTMPCYTDTASSNTLHIVTRALAVTLSGATTAPMGTTVTVNATVTGADSAYSLQWRNRGLLFATTTLPTVSYTKAVAVDSITATVVSASQSCKDSAVSGVHIVAENVSVGNLQLAVFSSRVYPNPVNNVLHVEAMEEIDELIISNVLGQTVVNSRQQNGVRSVALDVSGLSSGVYFVKVNGVCTNRFVKR